MSTEPKKAIEEQLAAFARQRREELDEPMEMPGPLRRRLQAEIRRHNEPPGFGSQLGVWLRALGPRFALAVVLLGFLFVATVFWFPQNQKPHTRVVKLESSDLNRPVLESQPGLATVMVESDAAASSVASAQGAREALALDDVGRGEGQRQLHLETANVPARGPAAAGVDSRNGGIVLLEKRKSEAQADKKNSEIESLAALPAVATSQAAEIVATPDSVVALANESKSALALAPTRAIAPESNEVWTYAEAEPPAQLRANFNSPPRPAILRRFQLEQTPSVLRIRDSDGSVFEGKRLDVLESASAKPAEELGGAEIRLTGRSRALQQPVVIDLQWPGSASMAAAESGSAPSLLTGKVRIGNRTEIPIRANRLERVP